MGKKLFKNGFTLIEVIIAVIIISTVIMALITMYANNTHLLASIKKDAKGSSYLSFLLFNEKYGFENDDKYIYDLVDEFSMDDDLRRKLKDIKVELIYQELGTVDMAMSEDGSSDIVFEVGKSIVKTKESSNGLLRLRLQ